MTVYVVIFKDLDEIEVRGRAEGSQGEVGDAFQVLRLGCRRGV
jgi:hypothetical protein